MKYNTLLFLISLVSFAMFQSCGNDENPFIPDDSIIIEAPIDPDFPTNPQMIDTKGAVVISFGAKKATITNPFEDKGVVISSHEAHVVVQSTATDSIAYVLTGSTPDGSLKIYSDTQFDLIMNGVDIVNSDDPALNIQSSKKATITLVGGTANRIAGGAGFTSEGSNEKMKGAFYSRGQLVISGAGKLTTISRYRHAICSDDYIRINGGIITIPMSANDGIHANDYIEINDGTVSINSIGDGIDSEGYVLITGGSILITTTGDKAHGIKSATETTVQTSGEIMINVEGDGSKAFRCVGDMLISQGVLNLTTSGDACYDFLEEDISSASGIKCHGDLVVNGGHVEINSSGLGGKGISVNGAVTINKGELAVTTTGDIYRLSNNNTKAKAIKNDADFTMNGGMLYADSKSDNAIDAKETFVISGGTVIGIGRDASKKGFAWGKSFNIKGGTIVGIGGSTSSPTASGCTQYVVNYSGAISQDAFFSIVSSVDKNNLIYQLPCTLSKAFLLFSSPDLERNVDYRLLSEGAVLGGGSFHGLYSGATINGGTVQATFTISSIITNIN